MKLYRLIKKPIVTEKSSKLSIGLKSKVYVFEVSSEATKIDLKKSIYELYGVEVSKVNIVNTREKVKFGRKGGIQLKRKPIKKAYVTLKDAKQKIDYTILK